MTEPDDAVRCPKCGSTQIHAGQFGLILITGFLGAGDIVITCLKCGHRFRPGSSKTPAWVLWALVAVLAILVVLIIIGPNH